MPYDELGNYIPDDTLTLDEMRYALLHSGQKAPPPGYEYAKPGRMPLRPDGSDVPMLPEEVARTLVRTPPPEPKKPYSTATNVPQAIADRLGMSAIPQAALQIATSFPAQVAKGMGYPETSKAIANFGQPTSEYANAINEALAAAPQKITGSHMGFGPMPETWITGLGNLSPNDARVIAKQNIERARELRAIPEDFRNAQAGFQRESALGGNTYGGSLQRVADDIGDVLARNQARRSEYANPMTGSVQVFGDMVPETAMYAVRPNKTGNQVVREVPTPLNPMYNATGESTLTEALQDIVNTQQPAVEDTASYQRRTHYTNMVPENFSKSAQDMFHDYITPALAREFPNIDEDKYTQALNLRYGQKNANDWYKKQLEAFAKTPEAAAHNQAAYKMAMTDPEIEEPFEFLKEVLIVPPSAKFSGAKAYDQWVMNNLQEYLVEHLGTPGDPVLKLAAETGRTAIPEDAMNQLLNNRRITDEAKNLRQGNNMPVEGTFESDIARSLELLGQNNLTIQLLQDQENELIANNPGVRPQNIPGWKEARKEVVQATKRKDETVAKLENLNKAQALENYNDTLVRAKSEAQFTGKLEDYEKERFPMFPSGSDVAYQLRMPTQFRELAKDLQNRLAISGAPGIKGLVKAEDISSYSVPKAVQIKAEMMAQRDKMNEQTIKANEQKLMTHTKARMEALPNDGVFGPATVSRISKNLGPEQIKSDLSDITYWMDHCIGRGGSPDKKQLSPMALMLGVDNTPYDKRFRGNYPTVLSHLNNKVPAGSSGAMTSYMTSVARGENEIADFRDTATGIPFATLNLKKSSGPMKGGMFRIGEAYGYQDRNVVGPMVPNRGSEYSAEENQAYRQAVADWANSQEQTLEPTNSEHLRDYIQVYDLASDDYKRALARELKINTKNANDVAYVMGKRFVTLDEARQLWAANQNEPKESIVSLRERRDELAGDLREAEEPDSNIGPAELDDLRYEIENLDLRIAAMENRPPVGAIEVAQVQPEWNRTVNQTREDASGLLDEDGVALMDSAIEETQNRFSFSQQPSEFVAELARRAQYYNDRNQSEVAGAIRSVANAYSSQILPNTAPAPQIEDLDTQLFGITNIVRENYGDTFANVVDFVVASTTDTAGSINDNPRQWIDSFRQNSLNYRDEVRQALDGVANELEASYLTQAPAAQALVPIAPERQGADSVAPLVRNALNALPNLRDNAFVTEIVAQQVIDLSGQVSFGQRPQDFVQQLRNRAQMLEETPGNGETNPDDNREAARQMRMLSNSLVNTAQIPAVSNAYATIRRANDHLVQAGDVEAMEGIVDNIMDNQNGPYAQLTDNERTALRAQLREGIDRVRADQDPTPLSDIIAMDMNRVRDEYGEAMEQQVDGTLTAIHDNYDIEADPALFIERVRMHADNADTRGLTDVRDIYNNLATILVDTLRENNAIADARRRAGNVVDEEDEGPLVLDDDQIDDIASDYLNNLDNPTPELIRQEAQDMRNGMTDLPEFRELTNNQRVDAQHEIAMRMEQHADMMEDMEEPPNQAPPALPAPEVRGRADRDAINDATRWPRFWFARYPDIPNDVVYEVISRLNRQHRPEDFAGMRENAVDANPRTIFRELNPVQRRQAAAMIDDIANSYQNQIQRIDNQQPEQQQYNTVVNAYLGILDANNQFAGQEGLDTLRALPQLLRRQNLRQEFGIANLSVDERNNLITDFEELYESRMRNPQLPPPEGHKRGGYIKKKMNDGGRVEPIAPSSSVNDHRQPVTPIKPIQNPDAPEFRDIFNRERANRSSVSAVSSMPDLSKYEPRIQELVRTGQIPLSDAAWMNEYSKTKGDSRVETGKGAFKDQSEKMQNFVNRMRAGEIPTPPQFKATVGGGGSGGGSGGADLKHLMNPRNITYRDGGSVSLDTMRYELTRKQ
jgi:hypothetical protein